MYTTYYIEDCNGNLYNYFTRLSDAKYSLVNRNCPGMQQGKDYIAYNDLRIVCLKGSYRYEGYHAYYMKYNGKKFKRELR